MSEAIPPSGPAAEHARAAELVGRMSVDEKAALCSGKTFWHLEANERLGVPSIMLTDGPHGLRKQSTAGDHVGLNASVPATCFPTASALASSWDRDLLRQIGVALGEQCVAEDVAVLLGPGMNIKRHPLCGRNFEYFSEDPLLTGEMAAALVEGLQSEGVGASLKHFAANNQEAARIVVDAIVDERTLREIYLRGFELAVRKAQPWTVMCAYNRLNGVYCSEHEWLLNRVLRDEWGFEGLVVTDWGAANDRVLGIRAGLDLEMPASGGVNDRRLAGAVRAGMLAEEDLDRAATRNVALALAGAGLRERAAALDHDAHHALARRAAAESVVLLKNADDLLPLSPDANVAVIGAFAQTPRYQGAGSSQVTPTRIDCAFDAIRAVASGSPPTYAAGYDPVRSARDDALIAEAVAAAEAASVAVVFAGLPGIYESEGFDREHMRLPEQHDRLIEAVCAANPNTVVVLSNGAPVEMPWVAAPGAIVEGYLGGQAGGAAVAEVLFGIVNPSGKLAETFPLRQSDVPADRWFPGSGRQVQYREGLYVGYRYFDSAGVPVLFPFGHGLSYTTFEYANLAFSSAGFEQGGRLDVTFDLTNTGDRDGSEVVQLYVHHLESSVYRPAQELRAFTRVRLAAGKTERVTLTLDDSAFSFYDTRGGRWAVEAGDVEVRIGASSRDIRLTGRQPIRSSHAPVAGKGRSGPQLTSSGLEVSDAVFGDMLGRPVPPPEPSRPYHVNSTITEIAETWLGRQIQRRVARQFQRMLGVTDLDETNARMFEEMAHNMPLRSLVLFSRGRLGFRAVDALLAALNGRFGRMLRILVRRSGDDFPAPPR